MKLTPKTLLGVSLAAILIVLTSLLILSKFKNQNKDFLTVTSEKNKFKINFQIEPKNQDDFDAILHSLNFPQSVKNGVEFELDSSTSARLAFFAPVKSSIKFDKHKVSLEGTLDYAPTSANIRPKPLKVPSSTTFIVFAKDLRTYLKKQFDIGDVEQKLFDDNLTNFDGQYLIIFGQKEFALFFKNDQLNIDDLTEIENQTSKDPKIFILKVTPNPLLLFQKNSWNIITTSQEAVNLIADPKGADLIDIDLTSLTANESSSLITLFRNPQQNLDKSNLDLFIKISGSKNLNESKIIDALNNVQEASFTLKREHFSALIKFK